MTRAIPVIRVIKVGGRPQAEPALPALLAREAAARPGTLILVHGGGDELSALQQAMGVVPHFVDGRRVTTESDLGLARMALSGAANKRLVAALVSQDVPAVGLSGEDASLITARPIDPGTLGYVGVPAEINVALLRLLMDAGYLPVISPVSKSTTDALEPTLNVNGDDAAAAIAAAIGAEELLLVSDVAAVVLDGVQAGQLPADAAMDLLGHSSVTGGMRAKVQAAIAALDAGVERVRISDLLAITNPARGTVFTRMGVLT